MNETEIDRIASAVHALRPDWPTLSLRTLMATKLKDRARRDVAVALTWVACESESKTPARVLEAGPWWKAVVTEGQTIMRYPPKRDEACPRHPGEWPETCRSCAADRLAGDDSAFNPRRTPPPESAVQLARENLASAKAGLCGHGIRPESCRERHDEEME